MNAVSNVRLMVADSEELRREVYRFRYRVYVNELCFDHADADHGRREIYDDADRVSTVFALVTAEGDIAATLRCSVLCDLPDPSPVVRYFGLQPFIDAFGLTALGTTSRFMFSREHRRTAELFQMVRAATALAQARNIRFNFGDTNAIWLEYFERLGYRRYINGLNDQVFGYHLRMVMLVRDLEYLTMAGSPLIRYIELTNDDKDARSWFVQHAREYRDLSPVGRTPEALKRMLSTFPGSVELLQHGAMRTLPGELVVEILMQSNFLEVYCGDILVRDAEVDDTAFICVKGTFVQRDRLGDQVAVFRPGDCFGTDAFQLDGRRTGSVTAQSDGLVLLLPSRQIRRIDRRFGRALSNWFAQSRATA